MSYENPTRLRIGMHGDFAGRDFRLLGRVVMGVTVNGENYFWNEFNLEAATGETATLVYEGTDDGGQWRLFTMFEPEAPLSATEAAGKKVGDTINLNGTEMTVTLVDQSKVYRIEGTAPEGVKVGSIANYFNIEADSAMQVVSWTGDEVEFYNGVNLSAAAVNQAFGLPREAASGSRIFSRLSGDGDDSSGSSLGMGKFLLYMLVIVVIFVVVFGRGMSCSGSYESAPVKHVYASSPPLTVGSKGHWENKYYRIVARATVQIGEVGSVYERHEYELKDDSDRVSLLVCGEHPGSQDWILYTPLEPLVPPTPQEAAGKKVGDPVNVAGVVVTISDLFQYKVLNRDTVETSSVWTPGEIQYGYAGQSQYDSLLVRWDQNSIVYYRGKTVPTARVKEFIAAFAAQ